MQDVAGSRVFVSGGHGFIGTALCRRLRDLGAEVFAPSRSELDVADPGAVATFKPQYVVHLAALTQRGPDVRPALMATNVQTTVALLEATRPAVFLHVGTLDEYGDGPSPFDEAQAPRPLSPYAASKAAAGMFTTMALGVHVRLSLVYGPGQGQSFFVPQLLRSLLTDEPLDMTAGEQVRDFVALDDVVSGLLRLLACPQAAGQVVNLCSGEGTALKDLVLLAKKVAGRSGAIRPGALPYRPTEVFHAVGSTSKLQQLVGWSPRTSLEEGLRQALASYTGS